MQTIITDYLSPEIGKLIAPAARVMNEHTNDHNLCAVCGSAWPCERAVLADLALSAV